MFWNSYKDSISLSSILSRVLALETFVVDVCILRASSLLLVVGGGARAAEHVFFDIRRSRLRGNVTCSGRSLSSISHIAQVFFLKLGID